NTDEEDSGLLSISVTDEIIVRTSEASVKALSDNPALNEDTFGAVHALQAHEKIVGQAL
ncbi:20660_t:CDS:2, partial [Funneliformis geosporum]